MKKFFSVLSVVGLAVSLAACSPAADNNAQTNQYRPMNVGPNNPTGTVTGYDRYHRYNNAAGYNAAGYNNNTNTAGYNNTGDGRYDTYRNGIIKDQTNHRPGALRDSRDSIMRSQGMNDLGINNNGQRMYGTNGTANNMYGVYGYGNNGTVDSNTHQYSIYKPRTNNYNVQNRSNQPDIGYVQLDNNQNGTGRTQNGTTVQNGNMPNNSTLYQGRQANDNTATPNVYVDRQMLASAVANVAKQVPGVQRTTVLTTDNQIFVGCNTPGLNPANAEKMLEKVQKGCENVSPRYYKVYTTNDQNIVAKVQNNATQMGTKTDQEFEQMIGHQANSMHKLSTNSESNKSSSSKSGTPTHKNHMNK